MLRYLEATSDLKERRTSTEATIATIEECSSALLRLSGALGGMNSGQSLDRSVSCRVPDLEAVFTGRLDGTGFHDISTDPAPRAQIRLTINSDDLVALADGKLNFGSAYAQRRVKVDASFGDLIRLRKLF